jgi:hypothetical protein
VAPPVFKTGLAGIAFAGGFDSLPPPLTGLWVARAGMNRYSQGQLRDKTATLLCGDVIIRYEI